MTPEEMREWIDRSSYETLLRRWRGAPAGDPFFQGEIGTYYAKVMSEKKRQVGDAEHVATSKRIGWDL